MPQRMTKGKAIMSESARTTFRRGGCAVLLWLGGALALAAPADPDAEWKETEAPPPPAFSSAHLLKLDMPPYVSMQLGIDPATLQVTPDGVVRYVVVISSPSGTVSALYEGLRCATAEVKTYARASGNQPWTVVKEPQWRGLNDPLPSKHALVFARQGACEGNGTRNKPADIVRAMKQ